MEDQGFNLVCGVIMPIQAGRHIMWNILTLEGSNILDMVMVHIPFVNLTGHHQIVTEWTELVSLIRWSESFGVKHMVIIWVHTADQTHENLKHYLKHTPVKSLWVSEFSSPAQRCI